MQHLQFNILLWSPTGMLNATFAIQYFTMESNGIVECNICNSIFYYGVLRECLMQHLQFNLLLWSPTGMFNSTFAIQYFTMESNGIAECNICNSIFYYG